MATVILTGVGGRKIESMFSNLNALSRAQITSKRNEFKLSYVAI